MILRPAEINHIVLLFYVTIKDAQIARGHPAKKAAQTQLIPAGR